MEHFRRGAGVSRLALSEPCHPPSFEWLSKSMHTCSQFLSQLQIGECVLIVEGIQRCVKVANRACGLYQSHSHGGTSGVEEPCSTLFP